MKLYKYVSLDRVDMLSKRLVRYTQPGAFNDPFEVRPYIEKLSTPEEAERSFEELLPEEARKALDALPAELRNRVSQADLEGLVRAKLSKHGASFAGLLESFTPMIRDLMATKFDEFLGILSLTEKPDNLLMWSHYAESHLGFVIGFDSTHPHFHERKSQSDEFRHLRKVEYRQDRPNMGLTELEGIDVFLVKSTHWEYEQEWRIMRALKHADQVISQEPFPVHLFAFPSEAIVEVILGARLQGAARSSLIHTIRNDPELGHVGIFEAVPHDTQFLINIQELDPGES